MNDQNMKLSVIAYYLSKFDLDAVKALGYRNRTDAINDISVKIGRGNNYLKQRRDEFDVLTDSHRRGYANRKPASAVLDMHNQLKDIGLSDYTDIVLQMVNPSGSEVVNNAQDSLFEIGSFFLDVEIEAIINAKDTSAAILLRQAGQKTRIYNPKIIENLKKLYQYRCQICCYSAQEYGVHIAEAHHILPFSSNQNNDAGNIIILCPNHHRLIHKAAPAFDRQRKVFVFSNRTEMEIKLNFHL